MTAGSGATAAGTITLTSTAAGTPLVGNIAIGFNQTQSTIYMVPRNYTAYINQINVGSQNITANATCDLGLFKRDFGGVFRIQADWLLQGGNPGWMITEYEAPLIFPAKSILLFKCIVAAGGTWDVRVDYGIFLVADSSV